MKKIYTLSLSLTLALLLLSVMAYGQLPELVARYALDEASGTVAADASGHGFDATVVGTEGWTDGTIDGAFAFDGATHITLPADVMGMTSNDGSVAFWMNSDGVLDDINTMFWGGDNTTGGGFGNAEDTENELHVHLEGGPNEAWEGGECSFFVIAEPNTFVHSDVAKGNPPGNAPVDPLLLGDGEWHHIAATWGEGYVALFIDGAVMWDTTLYNPRAYDLSNMVLGQMVNESRGFFGKLDDVRVYTGVLSSFEVEDLFNKVTTHTDQVLESENDLSIYPNPASSHASLHFSAEAGQHVSVNLYSLAGALVGNVYEGISASGENVIQLPVADYANGLYMVKLQIESKISYAKFVVQ